MTKMSKNLEEVITLEQFSDESLGRFSSYLNSFYEQQKRAERAARTSLVDNRIVLHKNVHPVIKKSGLPVGGLIGMILCSEALQKVEEELSPIVDKDDLHAALTFVCEFLEPQIP
jgi:hypothetical protein